jgi:pimeloyl-ACP methyl ester carboxylesterase
MFFEYIKGNQQMNLQINRQLNGLEDSPKVKADLKTVIPQIQDQESWFQAWNTVGETREQQKDFDIACSYFALAQFYLNKNDQCKKTTVHRYLDNFYRSHPNIDYTAYEVPYEDSYLPAVKVNINPDAKKTLLIINGFDSFMEELFVVTDFFKGIDYNIILFDGPGQGRALIDNDIKFTPYIEKAVTSVLDFFELTEVDALGVSWGGYFVVRAAAYEKRINHVICFDFFYDGLNVFLNGLPSNVKERLKIALKNDDDEVNKLLEPFINKSYDLQFKINKGFENTGAETLTSLLKNIALHNIRGLGSKVTQDVLLLAGSKDQYIPLEDLALEQKELSQAHSLTTKIFTEETGGEQHCQAGRYDLALNAVRIFLNQPALPNHETSL